MTPAAQIVTLEAIRKYLTAGNATFTLVSKRSGERKTFLVEATPPREKYLAGWFVHLLVGPDNTSDYRYLGFMYERDLPGGPDLRFKINKKKWGAEVAATFEWLLGKVNFNFDPFFFDQAEFWHSGNCGRCGRPLTVPESIATGLGPVCANR